MFSGPFIVQKQVKVLDLYSKNYKTMMKEIENETKEIEKYSMLMDSQN